MNSDRLLQAGAVSSETLIHTLQERLATQMSKEALTREIDLKRSLKEAHEQLESYKEDSKELEGKLPDFEEQETMYYQMQTLQQALHTLVQDLEPLPNNLETLFHRFEAGSISQQDFRQIVAWVEEIITRADYSLRQTESVAKIDSDHAGGYSTADKQQLANLVEENQDLKEQIAEDEETISLLRNREESLGISYNALLAEYEDLQQWVSDMESQAANKVVGTVWDVSKEGKSSYSSNEQDPEVPLRTDSELNNVMVQLDELQGKMEKSFSGVNSSSEGQEVHARNEVAKGEEGSEPCSQGKGIHDEIQRLEANIQNAKTQLSSKGRVVLENLKKATTEEKDLRESVRLLQMALPPFDNVLPTSYIDATPETGKEEPNTSVKDSRIVKLNINVTNSAESMDNVLHALYDYEKDLLKVRERLLTSNTRLFLASATAGINETASSLAWLDCCGIEGFNSVSSRGGCFPETLDDSVLYCKPAGMKYKCLQYGEIHQTEKTKNTHSTNNVFHKIKSQAEKFTFSRDQLGHLVDMTEFERFVLVEQQALLRQNEEQIEAFSSQQKEYSDNVQILRKELDHQKHVMEEFQKEISNINSEKHVLSEKWEQLQHNIYTQKEALEASQKDIKAISEKILDANNEIIELQRLIEESNMSYAGLQKELADRENVIRTAMSEYNQMAENINQTSESLQRVKSEQQSLLKQKQDINETMCYNKKQLSVKVAEGKSLMEEIKELGKREAAVENGLQGLVRECKSLMEIKRRRIFQIDDLQKKIKQQDHQRTELLQQIESQPKCSGKTEKHSYQDNLILSRNSSPRRAAGTHEGLKTNISPPYFDQHRSPLPHEAVLFLDSRGKKSPCHSNDDSLISSPIRVHSEREASVESRSNGRLWEQTNEVPPSSTALYVDYRGSASGDLLIKCLENELKRQQEKNEEQSQRIDELQRQVYTQTPSPSQEQITDNEVINKPQEVETAGCTNDPRHDSFGVGQLQTALKQALTDMDKLYERVASITEVSDDLSTTRKSAYVSNSAIPSSRSHSPVPSANLREGTGRRSNLSIKTKGQIRYELASAQKQVANLEEKLKGIVKVSGIKDRVISDLQKDLDDKLRKRDANISWKY